MKENFELIGFKKYIDDIMDAIRTRTGEQLNEFLQRQNFNKDKPLLKFKDDFKNSKDFVEADLFFLGGLKTYLEVSSVSKDKNSACLFILSELFKQADIEVTSARLIEKKKPLIEALIAAIDVSYNEYLSSGCSQVTRKQDLASISTYRDRLAQLNESIAPPKPPLPCIAIADFNPDAPGENIAPYFYVLTQKMEETDLLWKIYYIDKGLNARLIQSADCLKPYEYLKQYSKLEDLKLEDFEEIFKLLHHFIPLSKETKAKMGLIKSVLQYRVQKPIIGIDKELMEKNKAILLQTLFFRKEPNPAIDEKKNCTNSVNLIS